MKAGSYIKASKEKTVYLVRHAQSEGNVSPIFQEPHSPLSQVGQKQAKQIARRIKKITFDVLITSPYSRSRETAAVIAKTTRKTPEFSDLFNERVKPTSIVGKSYHDREAKKIAERWRESLFNPSLKVEDGENYRDLIKRADSALEFLKNRKEKNIVVITSGFFLRIVVARVLLGDFLTPAVLKIFQMHLSMENTGLSVLRYSAKRGEYAWQLWVYNDYAHLG